MFPILRRGRIDNEGRRMCLVGPLTVRMRAFIYRKGRPVGLALCVPRRMIGFAILAGSFLEGAKGNWWGWRCIRP